MSSDGFKPRSTKNHTDYYLLDEAAPNGIRQVNHAAHQTWWNTPDNVEKTWIARNVFPLALPQEAIVVLTQFTGEDGPYYSLYCTHIFAPDRIEKQLSAMMEQFRPYPRGYPLAGIYEQQETLAEALTRHAQICEFVAVVLPRLRV